MSIRIKLLITFFVFSIVLTFTMGGLMRWSFHQGFEQYVLQKQQERLIAASPILESYYLRQQSWNNLAKRPKTLNRLLSNQISDGANKHPRHTPSEHHFLSSVYVLDENKHPVVGNYRNQKPLLENSLQVNGKIVGYIGVIKPEKPFSHVERRFQERQGRSLFYIISVSLLLSLFFSWPLSKVLLSRVEKLADHIRELSQGKYNKRVSMEGRDELSGLTDHLNHLGESLQNSEQSRRKLVADISHELRTPLATLRAQLEALEDGVHQYNEASHQRLTDQVMRLSQLVDDLYTLSLADIGALQYRKTHCDIGHIINQVAESFQPQFTQAGIDLTVITQVTEGEIFADETRLTQLLSNLLQNSLQYTDAPGATHLSCTDNESELVVTVSDSAPTGPTQQLTLLLERLYRGDSSRNRKNGGAGLGLSLCKAIAEAHQGKIDIKQSSLGGLEVSVRLPKTSHNREA